MYSINLQRCISIDQTSVGFTRQFNRMLLMLRRRVTVCWSRRAVCAVYCNTSKCTRVLLQYVLEYVRTRGPTYSSVRTNVVRTEVLEYLGYDVVRQQSSLL